MFFPYMFHGFCETFLYHYDFAKLVNFEVIFRDFSIFIG